MDKWEKLREWLKSRHLKAGDDLAAAQDDVQKAWRTGLCYSYWRVLREMEAVEPKEAQANG